MFFRVISGYSQHLPRNKIKVQILSLIKKSCGLFSLIGSLHSGNYDYVFCLDKPLIFSISVKYIGCTVWAGECLHAAGICLFCHYRSLSRQESQLSYFSRYLSVTLSRPVMRDLTILRLTSHDLDFFQIGSIENLKAPLQ